MYNKQKTTKKQIMKKVLLVMSLCALMVACSNEPVETVEVEVVETEVTFEDTLELEADSASVAE